MRNLLERVQETVRGCGRTYTLGMDSQKEEAECCEHAVDAKLLRHLWFRCSEAVVD